MCWIRKITNVGDGHPQQRSLIRKLNVSSSFRLLLQTHFFGKSQSYWVQLHIPTPLSHFFSFFLPSSYLHSNHTPSQLCGVSLLLFFPLLLNSCQFCATMAFPHPSTLELWMLPVPVYEPCCLGSLTHFLPSAFFDLTTFKPSINGITICCEAADETPRLPK